MGKIFDYFNNMMAPMDVNTSQIAIHNVDKGYVMSNDLAGNCSALGIAMGLSALIQSDPPEIEEMEPNVVMMHIQTKQIFMLVKILEDIKRRGSINDNFSESLINELKTLL